MTTSLQFEVLDLRHFSGIQLRPLLDDQARLWQQRLHWDYAQAIELLLEYIDDHLLTGLVMLAGTQVVGYTFAVLEADKAVIGDVYAFGEADDTQRAPVCDALLRHLIEMLQATPGVARIEAQLLMFPAGKLLAPFASAGFHATRRQFLSANLPLLHETPRAEMRLPAGLRLMTWNERFYDKAAALIHRAYVGHIDSTINDQYQTVPGSLRFLHNIVQFPGCGLFDAANSWVLYDPASDRLQGLLLCSRIQPATGHITQLCLDPDLRGLGLGRALLHRAIAEFTRLGFTALSLTVTEQNVEARTLYEEYGFRAVHDFDAMVWKPG